MNYEIIKNDLFDYPNRYIFQLKDAFKFSLDSLLLAEYVNINKNTNNILDLCTGNGAIPLVLSEYTKASIVGFEIQKEIYDLAIKSVNYNKLDNQIRIINDDINNIKEYYSFNFFDIIVCNPPFFKIHDNANLNKNDMLSIARHELKIDLDSIFDIVKNYLQENGTFYMVHRPDRLDEIIIGAYKKKLIIKEIQLIITKKDNAPSIALFKIKKHGKPGIKMPRIIDISEYSTYQNMFKEVIWN